MYVIEVPPLFLWVVIIITTNSHKVVQVFLAKNMHEFNRHFIIFENDNKGSQL